MRTVEDERRERLEALTLLSSVDDLPGVAGELEARRMVLEATLAAVPVGRDGRLDLDGADPYVRERVAALTGPGTGWVPGSMALDQLRCGEYRAQIPLRRDEIPDEVLAECDRLVPISGRLLHTPDGAYQAGLTFRLYGGRTRAHHAVTRDGRMVLVVRAGEHWGWNTLPGAAPRSRWRRLVAWARRRDGGPGARIGPSGGTTRLLLY